MSEFVAPDGSRHAIFGEGGGRRLAEAHRRAARRRGARSRPRCRKAATTASRSCSTRPTRAAARAFTTIADQIVNRAAPAGRDGRLHRAHVRPRASRGRDARTAHGVRRGRRAVRADAARRIPTSSSTTVIAFGELRPATAALEIGAGTGKATRGFVARGLDVTALEPSPGMAEQLRPHARERGRDDVRGLVARRAARSGSCSPRRSWHWVDGADRLPSARPRCSGRAGRSRCSGTSRSRSTARSVTRSKPSTPRMARMSTRSRRSGRSTRRSASSTRRGCFDAVTKRSVDWVQHVHDRRVRRVDGDALEPSDPRRRRRGAPAATASARSIARHGGRVEVDLPHRRVPGAATRAQPASDQALLKPEPWTLPSALSLSRCACTWRCAISISPSGVST